MKVKALVILAIFILISCNFSIVVQASSSVTFASNKNEVSQGDTFSVTLTASDTDGINGIVTKYNYDESSLELIEAKIGSKLVSLGEGNKIEAICNSADQTNVDVVTLNFKVKDNIPVGKELNISTDEVIISNFGASDSKQPAQSVKVNVVGKAQPSTQIENTIKEETKNEEPKKQETQQETPKKEETKTSSANAVKVEQSKEISPKKLPKTGKVRFIAYACIGFSIIALISFYLYKKYYYL